MKFAQYVDFDEAGLAALLVEPVWSCVCGGVAAFRIAGIEEPVTGVTVRPGLQAQPSTCLSGRHHMAVTEINRYVKLTRRWRAGRRWAGSVLMACLVSGCATSELSTGSIDGAGAERPLGPAWGEVDRRELPRPASDAPGAVELADAQAHFETGAYGLAEKSFRKSLEKDNKNGEAWLGLAASYDQLGRFDLADRCYAKARQYLGNDPIVLNNQGYSSILRGDFQRAEKYLTQALNSAPNDPRIQENLALLAERRSATR